MLKRKKISMEDEKNIIIGMIISDEYLRDMQSILTNMNFLVNNYTRIVAKWCFEFYTTYEKAPKNNISDIFENRKSELSKEEDQENIETILEHLSEMYLENKNTYNKDYFFDLAEKYLKKRSLEILVENIKADIHEGNLIQAESSIANFKRIQKKSGTGIDIFSDRNAIIDALIHDEIGLFKMPNLLGELFQDFHRGDLVSVGAPMKRGKSWMLMEMGLKAAMQGLKVAYWTLEMKDEIMLTRFFQNLTGFSRKLDSFEMPFFDNDNNVESKIITKDKMNLNRVLSTQKRLKKQIRAGGLKLFDLTTGGSTVSDIKNTLENMEHFENWMADIVIVDYADILEPESDAPSDHRNRLNHTWLSLKKMAQKKNILIITASQMGRGTLSKDAELTDIAEDIRKFAHVSHWINLNQNKEEKEKGMLRISVSGRHDAFNPNQEVVILQCLSIGRFILDARWKKDVPYYTQKKEKKEKNFDE